MSRRAPGRHLLLWDGRCGFCRRSVSWIARHDRQGRLQPIPYQNAPPSLVSAEVREACANAVHVITSDGGILKAGRASLFILGELGWRRTARVLAWPPFVWGVELGYQIVSRNRNRISRWLPNTEATCALDEDDTIISPAERDQTRILED